MRKVPPRPAPRTELLHVLTLTDFDRVGAIQSYWGNPATRNFGELLINCEEDRTVWAVLVGMLRGPLATTEVGGSRSGETNSSVNPTRRRML